MDKLFRFFLVHCHGHILGFVWLCILGVGRKLQKRTLRRRDAGIDDSLVPDEPGYFPDWFAPSQVILVTSRYDDSCPLQCAP